MLKRTLVFSNPYHLRVKNKQLVIRDKEDENEYQAPIEDLGFVLLEHPAITLTQGVIQELMAVNAGLVFCDSGHMPAGITLPLSSHFKQNENHYFQTKASMALVNRLWQQTVKAKIRNQGAVLEAIGQSSNPLIKMAKKVKSGDTENQEARAAKAYWQGLFGPAFHREPEGAPPNPALNYVYAIIRAAVARALTSAGLSLTLGIHHRNKYNPFCLADDIMEPFRPLGDLLVWELKRSNPKYHVMTSEVKQHLLTVLSQDVTFGKTTSPAMVAMQTTAFNLASCFRGERQQIRFPSLSEKP